MRLALVGYGNVGRAFHLLLDRMKPRYPFAIVGIHTRTRPAAPSFAEFLDEARPDILLELTTLDPHGGQPAISYIEQAFSRRIHVVTANKGPIAFAYRRLSEIARTEGVEFRFESTVMDGAPVFNLVRQTLPGVEIQGFTGALNSTSNIILGAMRAGRTFDEGLAEAQRMGVAEADASFDIEGWDAASKCAALANVLLDAEATPLHVDRRGIAHITPERLADLDRRGKSLVLIARGRRGPDGVKLRVRPEVLDRTDPFASLEGTTNLLQLHTDLMGTIGICSVRPGVEQTAYGVFADVVDIARSV
ncbi:MAG: hypothetical protein SFV18_13210 [Bryobacteraceae bacterium]|nr:hypothetical protein [Bryobacteraceae bacterium]